MNKIFQKGDTGTYIQDHGAWRYVCDIPYNVATMWLETECWGVDLGCGKQVHQCENVKTDWENKLWAIVEDDPREIALYNYDGVIRIYVRAHDN